MPWYPVKRDACPTCTLPSSRNQSLGLEGTGAPISGCFAPAWGESKAMGPRTAGGVSQSRHSLRYSASVGFVLSPG